MLSVISIPIVEDYQVQVSGLNRVDEYIQGEIRVHSGEYIESVHRDFDSLTGRRLSPEAFMNLVKKKSVETEPLYYIEEAIETIRFGGEDFPRYASLLAVTYNGNIVGAVLVFIDPRMTFREKSLAYFIGIRKSTSLILAEEIDVRISEHLIPSVIDYAKKHGVEYAMTTPLPNMMKILTRHYGFTESENEIVSDWVPPVELVICEDELIVWKRTY